MEARRNALIIATDEYEDPRLRRLRAPARDAEELGRVLADDAIGGFEVEVLHNEPEYSIRRRLAQFFADRNRDDLLLVHFSCHGLKDDDGTLYFATPDTEIAHLDSTAVPSDFVNRQMQRSRSRRIALFLDCCYSGAFSRGAMARAGDGVQLAERFDGQGQVVITASNAMEYAFEGDELTGAGTPSVFTTALVEGLETGAADRDGDNLVSIDELYDYVYERVRDQTPGQTPSKWTYDLQGELYVARNPRPRPVTPAELPAELRQALESPLTSVRLGIIVELERLCAASNVRLASAARIALEDLVEDDSRAVAAAASEALERAEEVKPEAPPEPPIMSGSVRAPATFATAAVATPTEKVAKPKPKPEPEPPAAYPSWWPLHRVSPRIVVVALALIGAALILNLIRASGVWFDQAIYALGVAVAIGVAGVLVSLPRRIAASGCGALLAIGILSLLAESTFPRTSSTDSLPMIAAAIVLAAGVLGVAAIAGLRADDWTSRVRRSRFEILAACLALAGAGLLVAALVTPASNGFTLRDTSWFPEGAARIPTIAIVLGLAGLAVLRVVGGARLVLAGVLAGAGAQTLAYFAGVVQVLRYSDVQVQVGLWLGLAGGSVLLLAGCAAFAAHGAASR